jgi:hypothetical protein
MVRADTREKTMLKLQLIGAALIASAAVATPALAEVIQEPGAYAFYHPNGDLGLGSSRPASDAMASQPRDGNAMALRMSVKTHHRASSIRHY